MSRAGTSPNFPRELRQGEQLPNQLRWGAPGIMIVQDQDHDFLQSAFTHNRKPASFRVVLWPPSRPCVRLRPAASAPGRNS